jgi:uncharacterized protein YdhG (YjbR/CyaY superfamily)
MAPKSEKSKSSKSTGPAETVKGITAEERAAMKDRVQELRSSKSADGEADLLAKIAEMPEPDRIMAERLHALIKASAPSLSSKTWYGMPAYARDGDVVCFFQSSHKFKARYATLGLSDKANHDQGDLWPVAFALRQLTAEDEARIAALIRKAAS